MKILKFILPLIIVLSVFACKKPAGPIDEGNDPNFKIKLNEDKILNKFNRKVEVFGISIYAVAEVSDDNLTYAANIMAQYLDNDEDGSPDNQAVVDKMVEEKAIMIMWKDKIGLSTYLGTALKGRKAQDLGNDETHPSFVPGGKISTFDAALEEVLHLITHIGYAGVYPEIFGEKEGAEIAKAMDIARGGQFKKVPKSYPEDAWYTYDDKTCKYGCMVTEYIYWALTSMLGAQENRLDEIEQEWKLNTKEKVETEDPAIFKLLTDPKYKFPTILPDGTYQR